MRLCSLIIAFLFVALVLSPLASAADRPSGDRAVVRAGGLMCRSVHGQQGARCDAVCAKADMVCTDVADYGRDPPLACGDLITDTIAPFPVCRCCAVEH